MRVLVSGGCKFKNQAFIHHTLDKIHNETPIKLLITVGFGIGRMASYWCATRRVACLRVMDDTAKHGTWAKHRRHDEIMEYRPEMLVLFPLNNSRDYDDGVFEAGKKDFKKINILDLRQVDPMTPVHEALESWGFRPVSEE